MVSGTVAMAGGDAPVRDGGTFLAFPGQGAQYVGMGRRAHERSRRARELFARADSLLGIALRRLCFEGPAEELLVTRWQQPAILVCSLAILTAWEELFPREAETLTPTVVAGHSLGELSALVYAGALSFEQGVTLAHLRGSLMQEAADRSPGGMTAVLGLSAEQLAAVCAEALASCGPGELVVVANHNSPGQIVLSGTRCAVERTGELALEHGARRTVHLAVAGAFHSPLMGDAAREFGRALRASDISAPRLPLLANTTARPIRTADEVRAELEQQVTAPVLWGETVLRAVELGATRCVDAGPGKTLAGLARRTVSSLETIVLDRVVSDE